MSVYWFTVTLLRIFFPILFRIKVFGVEKIPMEGPLIFCCNHVSYADPLLLGFKVKRQISYLAKSELFSAPVLGKWTKAVGAIPVNRGKNDINLIRETLAVLKRGGAVALFPEGTRVKNDMAHEAKAGIGLFAAKSSATIIPVAIKTKDGHVKLFSKIELFYGDPITISDIPLSENGEKPDYLQISQFVMNKIWKLSGVID